MEGFDFHFAFGKNNYFARSSPREQQSTGLLHLIGSNPNQSQKEDHPVGGLLFETMPIGDRGI